MNLDIEGLNTIQDELLNAQKSINEAFNNANGIELPPEVVSYAANIEWYSIAIKKYIDELCGNMSAYIGKLEEANRNVNETVEEAVNSMDIGMAEVNGENGETGEKEGGFWGKVINFFGNIIDQGMQTQANRAAADAGAAAFIVRGADEELAEELLDIGDAAIEGAQEAAADNTRSQNGFNGSNMFGSRSESTIRFSGKCC